MATVASRWTETRARVLRVRRAFDSRTRRQRLLLTGIGMAAMWTLADSLWLDSAFKGWQLAQARRSTAAAALLQSRDVIVRRGVEARANELRLHGELAQWQARVARNEAELQGFGAALIDASEIAPMLGALLTRTGGLRLRSLQSLGRVEVGTSASPLGGVPKADPRHGAGALFRHGVELTVDGSYADVVAYLRAIEAMPQRVLWGGLRLKVEQHPKVTVTLRLYTLSLDEDWLVI